MVDMHILTQLVVVQDELGDRKAWPVDELRPYREKGGPQQAGESVPPEDMPDEEEIESSDEMVDSQAVTAELEEMARMEQANVSPQEKQAKEDARRSQEPNRDRPRDTSPNQKDSSQQSGDDKRQRDGKRGRRRRPKNKNRNNRRRGGGNQNSESKPKQQSD